MTQNGVIHEFQDREEQLLSLAAGVSLLLVGAAGVMALWARRRRQPTRLERAQAALIDAAERAELAARNVRKEGPGVVKHGALQVEQMARNVRKQGPRVVKQSGEKIEQLGRTIRKQGPDVVVRSADWMERQARDVRKQAPGRVAQSAGQVEQSARVFRKRAPKALEEGVHYAEDAAARTSAFGSSIAQQASHTVDRARHLGEDVASSTQSAVERVKWWKR